MGAWARVKWTEAGQIADLLGWTTLTAEDRATAPADYFSRLRAEGRLDDAAMFIGHALPKFDTVAWAARALTGLKPAKGARGPDAEALATTVGWVKDPSDANRRAAYAASAEASPDSPERLIALAAFFSGGSMAPADCPPVQAPREAAGRFASAAVIVSANAAQDRRAALAAALDLGETLARDGPSTE